MEKNNEKELMDNTFVIGHEELLKIATIYGANASGKSNLIKAFTSAILMVRNSNVIALGSKWNFIKPFKFDETTNHHPSEFEFVFIANNIKYKYCFSADNSKIVDESLVAYYSQKPTTIFSRTNTDHYEFLTSDENILKTIVTKNTDNKLFLSTATTWNYDKTKDAFLWFMNQIDTYDTFNEISNDDLKKYTNENDDLKAFTLKLLEASDIFIKDFNIDYQEKDMDTEMINLINPTLLKTPEKPKVINVDIELEHEIIDSNNKSHTYKLNMNDESSGTKILFSLSPILKKAFSSQRIIIVDELEKSLHPALVEFIIQMFNNKNINKVNSQLIFTTHALNLMNSDIFRRDQIWFAEKNNKTGNTELFPLDSFNVRKSENIQKGYINGRYGAIPFINDNNLWGGNN